MDGIEIASAYIALTLKMPGVKKDAEKAIGEAEGVASDSGKRAGSNWGKALAAGVLAAAAVVTAAVAGLYNIGGQFDAAQDNIRIFATGSAADLEGLEGVVSDVSASIPANLEDISTTVALLHQRLGLTGDDLQMAAEQYLEAGRLFGEEIDVQTTTGLFNVFDVGAADVSVALDTLFNAARVAGVGMNQLSSTVASAAPVADLLGLSFEETTGFIASLSKAGIDASRVSATLGPALTTLAKDGEQPADAFRRVVGEMEAFVAAGDIASAQNIAATIFGSRGAGQFVAALASGAVNMDDLAASTRVAGDTILGVAADTNDAAESWQVFKNNALLAIQPVAEAVFGLAGDGMSKIADWAQANAPVIAGFFETLVASIGPIASQVLELWTQFSPLSILLQVIGPLLPQLGAAFALLAQPVGQIVQMIAMLAAQLLPMIMPLIVQLIGVVVELIAAFLPLVAEILVALMPMFEALIPLVLQIVEAILPLVGILIEALAPILTAILPLLGEDGLGGVLALLAPIIAALVPPIASVVEIIAGFLAPVIQLLADLLKGLIDFIVGVFTGDWERAWGGIVGIFRGIWNGIVGIVEAGVNAVITLINNMIRGVNNVAGAVGLPPIGLLAKVNFGFAQLEDGGLISHRPGGMLAQIGEGRYDELVLPLSPKVLGLLQGNGDDPAGDDTADSTEPVSLDEASEDRLARKIAEALAPKLRVRERMGVSS
jgi:TP901 family phage tail tape measure protein